MSVLTRVASREVAAAAIVDRNTLRSGLTFRAADGFEVTLPQAIVDRLTRFGADALPREWMGLLAVRRERDAMGSHAHVVGVVPFENVAATRVSVATTPAAEQRARLLFRLLYPDALPGGWVHTHPGHTAFYSGTDRANQRKWRGKDDLGVVLDPTRTRDIKVYRGPDSEELVLVETEPEIAVTWDELTPVDLVLPTSMATVAKAAADGTAAAVDPPNDAAQEAHAPDTPEGAHPPDIETVASRAPAERTQLSWSFLGITALCFTLTAWGAVTQRELGALKRSVRTLETRLHALETSSAEADITETARR